MNSIAFIFARGGSKGLPGKNIKPLLGKPLIQYAIEVAQQTPEINTVYVSTDDNDIAQCAKMAGAEIIIRPPELATDQAPEWAAWQHAIGYVKKKKGNFDIFVSLPVTSPLRISEDVSRAIAQLKQSKADLCLAVTPANRNPYFNIVTRNKNNKVSLVNPLSTGVHRRQDAPVVFDITTVVYAAKVKFILQQQNLFSGDITSIEVPKERAVDIDDIYDFMLAENILKVLQNAK